MRRRHVNAADARGTAGGGADQRRRPGQSWSPTRARRPGCWYRSCPTTSRTARRAGLPPQASTKNPVDVVASATAACAAPARRRRGRSTRSSRYTSRRSSPLPRTSPARSSPPRPPCPPSLSSRIGYRRPGPRPPACQAQHPRLHLPEQAAAALGRSPAGPNGGPAAGHVGDTPGIDARRGRALVGKVLASQPGGRGPALRPARAAARRPTASPPPRSRLVRAPQRRPRRPGRTGRAGRGQDRRGHPQERRRRRGPRHQHPAGGIPGGDRDPRCACRKAGLAGQAREFLVQEQIGDGVEMIVGVTHDPALGPLVLAGLGGAIVEVLGDVAVRIRPVQRRRR